MDAALAAYQKRRFGIPEGKKKLREISMKISEVEKPPRQLKRRRKGDQKPLR